ncbi:MAG: NAD(+)/NADH kinase [Treponema sp.]|nr:NAD(+)/NADH kinase [Treponema sp.]
MKGVRQQKPHIRNVILFINPRKKRARALGDEIRRELEGMGIRADTFSFPARPGFDTLEGYDAAMTLGGDGTVLYAARTVSPGNIPIFPVNLGTFGFIAGISPLKWREVFGLWLDGHAPVSQRLMLEITVQRAGAEILNGRCLNDVVVSASGIAKIISLGVSSGVAGGEAGGGTTGGGPGFARLGSYRCDGLIAATPTGSTAHSLAAGGPIVDPELEALILNPICPFTLSHRPMLLSAGQTLLIEVEEDQRSGVLLTVDGQVTEKLKSGDTIYIRKAPYQSLLVASGRAVFYEALKTKLSWAGGDKGERHA